jgi:carboxyvinyl-carboxyphosphonate phosphorylmutase
LGSTDRRNKLRAILSGERCVALATVFDPISARFAQELGFEAGLVGGSLVSHVVLGAPDLIILTLTELAEQVHRCARVSAVPLVIDGDHGYGNALSVMRTVQELDAAGAGGVMIEDTLLPRPYGPAEAPQLLPMDESLGKIRAAVKARGDSDIVVFGRTSAPSITGVEDAIARFTAYEAAGVDALMMPGLKSRDDLDRIAAATRLPLLVGGIAPALCDTDYLASRRVRLWSGGHNTFNVAVNALHAAMKSVRDGTIAANLPGSASKEVMNVATGAGDYQQWTAEFLGGK